MKKVLLLLISLSLVLCILPSCAKKEEINENGESVSNVYDDKGFIEKKIFFNDDGSENSEYKYEYDDYGNIISEIKYMPDGKIDSKSEYKFEKFGNEYKEVKRVVYNSENDIEFYQDDYKYDKMTQGGVETYLLVSYTTYDAKDKVKSKTEFSYDKDGNLNKMSTYDAEGNRLSENQF